jgi:hypothetical protein
MVDTFFALEFGFYIVHVHRTQLRLVTDLGALRNQYRRREFEGEPNGGMNFLELVAAKVPR